MFILYIKTKKPGPRMYYELTLDKTPLFTSDRCRARLFSSMKNAKISQAGIIKKISFENILSYHIATLQDEIY